MAKKSRFGNIKKHIASDGTVLDSKRECQRYEELCLLQKAGEIVDLLVHPRYKIIIRGVPILLKSARYPGGRVLTYVADFSYKINSNRRTEVIEDVKMQSGYRTEQYRIKRALMDAMGYYITEY